MKTGVYAGSFDPMTLGHLDIMKRAFSVVDKLIVGVAHNIRKNYLFSIEERISFIENTLKEEGIKNFEVKAVNGLLVDFTEKENANLIIRGIRGAGDFDYEFQMGMANQELNPKIETVFLLPKRDYIFVSSSTVKEIAYFKRDVSIYVPKSVAKALKDKYRGI